MRTAVLGAGSWGTALGATLAAKGYPVTLWDADRAVLESIAERHENARYLPGVALPATLGATHDLARAMNGAELVVLAVPSPVVRRVAIDAKRLLHPGVPICSAAKGIEVDTLMTMSEVLEDVLPVPMHPYLTFLSGPSFAREVAAGLPTAVTIAGRWERITKAVQAAFHTRSFRPYTTTDVVGVEVAGSVKNVIAIAAGLSDGMGFGANARAALITRGLVEMSRLAVRKGANPITLSGLSGLGDLVLTCSSEQSRNYTVGQGIGRGQNLEEVQKVLGQVAEGVVTARSTRALARKLGVEMPICETVCRVLHEGQPARQAVTDLMTRETKPEN